MEKIFLIAMVVAVVLPTIAHTAPVACVDDVQVTVPIMLLGPVEISLGREWAGPMPIAYYMWVRVSGGGWECYQAATWQQLLWVPMPVLLGVAYLLLRPLRRRRG